jgi:type II secretory pathway pseudopilin PulG
MAALLVSLAVMSVLMSVALPVWRQEMRREKEAELIFRGEQYARAIELYQRKYPGAFPPDLDVLVAQRFLRKKYKDPMTEDGEFQVLYVSTAAASGTPPGRGGTPTVGARGSAPSPPAGTAQVGARGGIIGVVSKSQETSIKLYKGRNRYSEWQFVYAAVSQRPGGPALPGAPGRPGGPGPVLGAPGRGGRGGPGGMTPGGRGPRGRGPGLDLPEVGPFPPRGRGPAPVIRPPGGRGS